MPALLGLRRFLESREPLVRVALVLAALGVGLRLAHLALIATTPLVQFHREFVDSDMWFFDQWVHHIESGDWLGRTPFHPLAAWQLAAAPVEKWEEWYGTAPTFYKAPFYAYLVAALGALHVSAIGVFALQALAAGVSAWLLFRITRRLFDLQAAVFAIALFALYGPDIHFTTVLLRGPWIVLTTLLVTDRLLAAADQPSLGMGLGMGLAVAASIVVNEGMTPLLVLAPLSLLLAGAAPRRAWRTYVGAAFGVAAGVAPVIVRNLVVGAPPLQMAVTGTVVLAVFNSSTSDPLFFSARAENFEPVMRASGASLLETLAACASSFASLSDWAVFYLRKGAGLLAPFENPDNLNYYYVALVNPWLGWLPAWGTLIPLAVIGAILGWERRGAALWCWFPSSLTLLAAMVLTLPLSRYRAVWAIHLMPLAGLALGGAASAFRGREVRRLALMAAGLLLVALAQLLAQQKVLFAARSAAAAMYRPPEFVLSAKLEAAAGRFAAAAREMEELALRHPDPGVKAQALELADRYRSQIPGKAPASR